MFKSKFEGLIIRLITALVGVSLIFSCYYFFQSRGLYCLSTLASLLIGYEAGVMCFKNKMSFIPLILINALWFAYFYFNPDISFLFLAVITSLTTWVWSSRFRGLSKDEILFERRSTPNFILFSLICPTFVLAHLTLENGVEKFALLLFSVFLFDTLSFFYGKTLGGKIFKTPLYPSSSPTKTIEGALFAGFTSIAILIYLETYTVSLSPFYKFPIFEKILLISAFYILALTGDLVESLLKRAVGTKDSGSFLPGHGGFFDRLDGVLFAGILSYLLLQ